VPCVSWISAARPVPILVDDPAPGKERLVDLQFYHPLARSVRVAGSFSGGQARSLPLQHLGGGAWVARLRLAPGKYQYHFLVDGERKPDPLATELVEDRRGQVSSVMAVG
jgi:1,4-alpha-glucan branching enzyme